MTCNLVEVIDVWKKRVATILKVEAACGKIRIQDRVDCGGWVNQVILIYSVNLI